jgi:hypothetical protein
MNKTSPILWKLYLPLIALMLLLSVTGVPSIHPDLFAGIVCIVIATFVFYTTFRLTLNMKPLLRMLTATVIAAAVTTLIVVAHIHQ